MAKVLCYRVRGQVWSSLAAAGLCAAALASCDARPKTWKGFVYPDQSNLSRVVKLGEFPNFEQCQVAAIEGLEALGAAERGDFECGFQCRVDETYGIEICKETRN